MDRRVDITSTDQPISVKFSYSVLWEEEQLEWKDRMSRYADSRFVPSSFEIHWLSIINSFVLVLLLTAFLTIILLRVLKNDFSRYMELDDDALEEEEVRPCMYTDFVCARVAHLLTMISRRFSCRLAGNLSTETSFVSQRISDCSVPLLVPETISLR
jgi:Endomembrane protein 70